MNEEEKKAIEQLRSWRKYIIEHRESVNKANDIEFYLRTALNLIEKQQKELNTLKEIEQLHQEENGKLRAELEQEKGISEYWQDRFLEQVKYGNKITVSGDPVIIKNVIDTVTYDYIHKDKIRERIEQTKKVYEEEMKPYQTEYGLDVTYLSKKEKEELINKRNCLLVQIKAYEMLLEEK